MPPLRILSLFFAILAAGCSGGFDNAVVRHHLDGDLILYSLGGPASPNPQESEADLVGYAIADSAEVASDNARQRVRDILADNAVYAWGGGSEFSPTFALRFVGEAREAIVLVDFGHGLIKFVPTPDDPEPTSEMRALSDTGIDRLSKVFEAQFGG